MATKRSIQPVLNALTAFEEAARTSSFTSAGQSLGMAQPSVSRFVANLENQIGVALFTRKHNRVVLTQQGEKLYQATTLGLGHIRSVIDEISSEARKRIIAINCTHGFSHMWILPRIDNLKARLVDWEIHVVTTDQTAEPSNDVDQMVVCFGDGNWPGRKSLLLFYEDVFPVCSPDFADRHGLLTPHLKAGDLSNLPLLAQDSGDYGWLSWPSWFAYFGAFAKAPPAAQVINNYAFILQAAMEGRGITLAWQNLIEPYLANGWLVSLSKFRVTTDKGYYLVLPSDHPIANDVRAWIAGTSAPEWHEFDAQ